MAWEIVRQPHRRGQRETLYARFTTVTMSNTHSDLSAPQMVIRLVREGYCSVEEARRLVEEAQPARKGKTPYQSGKLSNRPVKPLASSYGDIRAVPFLGLGRRR